MAENYESLREKRKAEIEALREQLKTCDMDGPYEIRLGGGMFDVPLTNDKFRYAICDICGAMVKLDDPIEINDLNIERGILRHTAFHGPKPEVSDG